MRVIKMPLATREMLDDWSFGKTNWRDEIETEPSGSPAMQRRIDVVGGRDIEPGVEG